VNKHLKAFRKGLKPDPYIDLVEWSNTYRYLPKESSVEPGRYRTSRTPYAEEILRELSPQSPTNEIVVVKPTQMGFTEIANNFLFCIAHRYPGPAMFAQPTDLMVKKHSKKKIAPSVRAMPCLKGIIKEAKSRDSGNTQLLKEFPGGSWTLTGSNSPTSARSDSIRYLVLDDYDGFIQDAGGEGAPGELMKNRTDAFGSKRKIYINSTPTTDGTSHIDREWQESSQGYYNVPCPHCNVYQYLEFGGLHSEHGIKFTRDDDGQITDVWYVCKHCQARIEEWQKTEMMAKGRYVHKYPDRRKRGFKVNSLYSPLGWLSWRRIMTEFLSAKKKADKGSTKDLKKWTNTRAAETWQEEGEQPDWTLLQARAEPYKILTIPEGGMFIVAGVDTQDNRLEVVIQAFGEGEECWVIYYGVLYGDPDRDEVWSQLDELLFRSYEHASGANLRIATMGIDSGGHKTQAVYRYCRKRKGLAFPVKGVGGKSPIRGSLTKQDVNVSGKKIKSGISILNVGVDAAKRHIYARLKFETAGPGFYHFPIGLSDEFYLQLTAEKEQKGYNKEGYVKWQWVKIRTRNEVLDCFVYAYAVALLVGLERIDWERLKKSLISSTEEQPQKLHRSQKPVKRQPLQGRNLNPFNKGR